jgi:hypothetical protein
LGNQLKELIQDFTKISKNFKVNPIFEFEEEDLDYVSAYGLCGWIRERYEDPKIYKMEQDIDLYIAGVPGKDISRYLDFGLLCKNAHLPRNFNSGNLQDLIQLSSIENIPSKFWQNFFWERLLMKLNKLTQMPASFNL